MNPFTLMKPVLSMFQEIILFLCKVLGVLIAPYFIMFFFFMLFYYLKGYRCKKPKYRKTYKKRKLWKLLLIDFPRRLVLDFYKRNPDALNEYGVHLVAGEQGSGKSIFVVWLIQKLKKMYPGMMVCSNIDLKDQDFLLKSSDDFMYRDNGELGMMIFLDEIQNWFCSMESKNFSVDMLQEITQQRKQRKMIIGTSQVFTRVAKPIREQTTLLYKPLTLAGCLTIVRVYKPNLKEDGTVKKARLRKLILFVHTDELRNGYNTYEKVKRQYEAGLKPPAEQLTNSVQFSLADLDLPNS